MIKNLEIILKKIKTILLCIFVVTNLWSTDEHKIRYGYKNIDGWSVLMLENKYLFNITYKIKTHPSYNLNKKNELIGVLKPNSRVDIARIKKNTNDEFIQEISWTIGDLNATHDDTYVYDLPVARNKSVEVVQASDEVTTHAGKHKYAIDFDGKEDKEVYAARDGLVVVAYDKYTSYGLNKRYIYKANRVIIKHSDGTYSNYAHLSYNSIKVKVGDYVDKGQYLGQIGLSGYTAYPHLHFEVVKATSQIVDQSVDVRFLVNGNVTKLKMGQKVRF